MTDYKFFMIFLLYFEDVFQITYAHISPPMVLFLANDLSLENVNLRQHLRTLLVGGASIDPKAARRCKERLGIRDLRQGKFILTHSIYNF